jgi:predicted CXXCH cytochrome family protein
MEKNLLPSAEIELCLSCHGDNKLAPLKNIRSELKGKKYLHGPIATGECTGCHDPHGNDKFRMLKGPYPATLYAPYSPGTYDACLRCHEKNLLRFAETTVYTKFRNGKRNLHYVHVADSRKGRSCRLCHEPHASDGPKLTSTEGPRFGSWKIPFRLELTTTGGRCSSGCHESLDYDRAKPVLYLLNKSPRFTAISSSQQGETAK